VIVIVKTILINFLIRSKKSKIFISLIINRSLGCLLCFILLFEVIYNRMLKENVMKV